MKLPALHIGNLTATVPIVQGGMGIGVSLSGLASAVANEGGVGVISAANVGFNEPDFKTNTVNANLRALKSELLKAREKAQTGIIGVTEGIYNDMIAYSKTSDLMADEDFRKALGEAFIEIAQTDEGKEIISVFSQVGYTWGKDSDYDGERDAQAMLKSAGK